MDGVVTCNPRFEHLCQGWLCRGLVWERKLIGEGQMIDCTEDNIQLQSHGIPMPAAVSPKLFQRRQASSGFPGVCCQTGPCETTSKANRIHAFLTPYARTTLIL